ncbi:MAG: hypothetical protein JJD98_21290 [Polaromonas sp.]|nr:hypothetical protein [Polaromonas sp.]
MPSFNNSQSQNGVPVLSRMARPRFLQAIPSLLVLTTAIAWGASSHAAGLGLNDGARVGTNVNVTAQERIAAMAATGSAAADFLKKFR